MRRIRFLLNGEGGAHSVALHLSESASALERLDERHDNLTEMQRQLTGLYGKVSLNLSSKYREYSTDGFRRMIYAASCRGGIRSSENSTRCTSWSSTVGRLASTESDSPRDATNVMWSEDLLEFQLTSAELELESLTKRGAGEADRQLLAQLNVALGPTRELAELFRAAMQKHYEQVVPSFPPRQPHTFLEMNLQHPTSFSRLARARANSCRWSRATSPTRTRSCRSGTRARRRRPPARDASPRSQPSATSRVLP